MSTESDDRKLRDGNHTGKLWKPPGHHTSTAPGRRPSDQKSYASAATDDVGSKRQGDTQPATKSRKEVVDLDKSEQRLSKDLQENHQTPSSTSEDHHEPASERPLDPLPSATAPASKKGLPLPGNPAQNVRWGSGRSNPQSGAQLLPAGAAPANRFDGPRQEIQSLAAAADTMTTSGRSPKTSTNKPDSDPDATPASFSAPHSKVDPQAGAENTAATTATPEVRKKGSPEGEGKGENPPSRTLPDSEATPTSVVAVDGASIASGMLGGIANALGMRPPTAKEAHLEKQNRKLKDENKWLRSECYNLEQAARKYHHEAFRLHHDNQRLQETLEAMSNEVKGVTKRYEEAKSLSDTRGKELLGAQVFLTKADGLSISELIQKVDALNDEIYQAAASLGESIVQQKVAESSEQPHYTPEDSATAKSLLGPPLCKILRSRARKTDEAINLLLVQITLQTFFSVFCIHRIRSWIPSHIDFDLVLQQLYEKIWSSSNQAVSGRWRSLTRAQLKPDTNGWIKELTTELDAILGYAGWEVCSPDDKHTLEARLPAIFKVVLDVRDAIGEKFTSADIEVTYVEPNIPINNVYMEEAYAADSDGPEKEPEIVIATVGMGIRKVVLLNGDRAHEYVLSPKVVLESSLKAILEPPPPRPTRAKPTKRP